MESQGASHYAVLFASRKEGIHMLSNIRTSRSLFSVALMVAFGSAGLMLPSHGQILHLRADDPTHITTDLAGNVLSWQNEVGSGQLFTPTAGTGTSPTLVPNAIGGLPAIRFNGIDNVLSSIGFGAQAQELTLFVVTAPLSNAGSYRDFFSAVDSSTPGHYDYLSGINLDMTAGGSSTFDRLNLEGAKGGGGGGISLPFQSSFGVYNLLEVGYGDLNDTVYVNGNSVGGRPGNTNIVSLQDLRIGARYYDNGGGETGYLNGDIAEVILYDRLLSDTERQTIEQGLAGKYSTPFATSTPEPGSLALLFAGGLCGATLFRRKKSRKYRLIASTDVHE